MREEMVFFVQKNKSKDCYSSQGVICSITSQRGKKNWQNLSCILFFQLTYIFTIQIFYLNSFTSSSKLVSMLFHCTELPKCISGYFITFLWEDEVNNQLLHREPYDCSLFSFDRFKCICLYPAKISFTPQVSWSFYLTVNVIFTPSSSTWCHWTFLLWK